jgi:hypothetical protein
MIHLGQLEQRLNSDAQFRQRFYTDPVGVLQGEGILLSTRQEMALRIAVHRASVAPARTTSPMDAVVNELGNVVRDARAVIPGPIPRA